MKAFNPVLLLILIALVIPFTAVAHPRHTDPVLEELNDYLMAIQILRIDDREAEVIFQSWDEVRKASWKIRKLTEDKDLDMDSEKVQKQVRITKELRLKLLDECREYFADKVKNQPVIRFELGETIQASWNNPIFEVQVQHMQLLLCEIRNLRESHVHLSMSSPLSDEILFWNKHFTIEKGATRYTFLVLSPLEERLYSNTIQLKDGSNNEAVANVSLMGTPMKDEPFALLPGNSIFKVKIPDGQKKVKAIDLSEGIRFTVTDAQTGTPLPARVEVRDGKGKAYWSPIRGASYASERERGGGTVLWKIQPGPYFYIDGEATLGVAPENKNARFYHGFEYKPRTVEVPEDGQLDVALERWIDMPGLGWYSGQTHIHTTDVGMPVQFTRHWPLVAQAEDFHVSEILTLKGEWETHAIYASEYPMGKRAAFSTKTHLISYGEEYRNNPYGHLCFLGLNYLIQPISSGALGELGGADYPPNSYVLDEALDNGAITIAAHFGNYITLNKRIETPWPSSGFEMPADVALGKINLAEVYGAGGQINVWYDLLSCGFRLPATSGPDWTLKDAPRVYVHLGDRVFNLENWREGLQRGESFITRGPMIFLKVNGENPGHEFKYPGGKREIKIKASALIPEGELPVELVHNGKVVASGMGIDTTLVVDDSGWIAARCNSAHTNPVYIEFEGRPAGFAAPAKQFITISDQLAEWVKTKGLFDSPEQKEEMLKVLEEGKKVYKEIIILAEKLGRN